MIRNLARTLLWASLCLALAITGASAVQNTKWYADSVAWTAVTAWPSNTSVAAGSLIRQNAAPTVGNERVFAETHGTGNCTTTNGTEPTWGTTKGAKTTDNGCTWIEVTGQPCVNNDTVNSPTWATNKNGSVLLGMIIYDSNTNSCQVVFTAGTEGNGSAPSFSATAGTATSDNTVTWHSLGTPPANWSAPFARIVPFGNSGYGTAAGGDTLFIASEHAETQASTNEPNIPGTNIAPALMISVNKAGSMPPVAADYLAGASMASTGGNNQVGFATGSFYLIGMTLNSSALIQLAQGAGDWQYYKNCKIIVSARNNGSDTLQLFGNAQTTVIWDNTTVKFGNASNTITVNNGSNNGHHFEWLNTASAIDNTGAIPTLLFSSIGPSNAFIHGVDLSPMTSGTLFTMGSSQNDFVVSDSKINAGATLFGAPSTTSNSLTLVNVDSGATGYRNEWHTFGGDVTTGTTTVRTGGATDGVQAIDHQFVSGTGASVVHPMVGPRVCQWSTFTSGSHTATIEVAGAQSLNNNDMWLELEYLGSGASPLSSFVSTGLANPLSTSSALTTSSASWSGSPANKQKITATFTPAMKGLVCGRVMFGKPSTTESVDPVLTLSYANDNAPLREVA